jgi:hypothetical protein
LRDRQDADAQRIKAATRKVHGWLVEHGTEDGLSARSFRSIPDQAIFEALVQRAHELRFDDPQEMKRCGFFAMWLARRWRNCAPRQRADLNARGLAEYANALRVADRPGEALDMHEQADQWLAVGTGDPVLRLRLKDLRASLYGSLENYERAIELAHEVVEGRLNLGDWQGAATALVQKALYTGNAGRLEEELLLLADAEALIGEGPECEVQTILLQNRLAVLLELERASEALPLLNRNRAWLWVTGGRATRVKLNAIEARIHARLGHGAEAARGFHEARLAAVEAGCWDQAALASLDLAALLLQQSRNRYAEATALTIEALEIFSGVRVLPRLAEALSVLSDALREGLVTGTLLQSAVDFAHRTVFNRKARYQPRFE